MHPAHFSPNLSSLRLVLLLLAPLFAIGMLYLALRAYPFDEDALKYAVHGDGRVRYTENLQTLGELIGFGIIEPPEAVIGLPLHYALGTRAPDGSVLLYYGDDLEQFSISQSTSPGLSPVEPDEIDIDGTRLFTWPSYDRFVNYSWHGCERSFHIAALAEEHGARARSVTESLVERCPGEERDSSVSS